MDARTRFEEAKQAYINGYDELDREVAKAALKLSAYKPHGKSREEMVYRYGFQRESNTLRRVRARSPLVKMVNDLPFAFVTDSRDALVSEGESERTELHRFFLAGRIEIQFDASKEARDAIGRLAELVKAHPSAHIEAYPETPNEARHREGPRTGLSTPLVLVQFAGRLRLDEERFEPPPLMGQVTSKANAMSLLGHNDAFMEKLQKTVSELGKKRTRVR